jgi:serine/threonine protein kinase
MLFGLCRLGVVHRDIKPENFLLGAPTLLSAPAGTAANVLKISDFGVSAFHQPGEVSLYWLRELMDVCVGGGGGGEGGVGLWCTAV